MLEALSHALAYMLGIGTGVVATLGISRAFRRSTRQALEQTDTLRDDNARLRLQLNDCGAELQAATGEDARRYGADGEDGVP